MKRHSTIVLTILSSALLAIAGAAVQASGGRTAAGQQAKSSSSQDRARAFLVREVRHELVMLPYYGVFDWLQFEVQGEGDVILRGQVTRPTLKSSAENVVKDLEGVTKVDNQIEVLPLSPNDDRIRRAVYRTLFNFNGPLYRYGLGALPSIHIIVKNGNVTLKGVVDNEADSNLANIRVRGVPGVFAVKNELTVNDDR